MTTVNDGFNRDLNSLVKNRRKSPPLLQAASGKQPITASIGTGNNGVSQTSSITSSIASPLTEVSRVEESFVVPAGGTVYVPTQITMQDANGTTFVFNYEMPTIA